MSTQERVMAAMERFERDSRAAGLSRCESCGDWHHGTGECSDCRTVQPVVTLAAVIGLAMLSR